MVVPGLRREEVGIVVYESEHHTGGDEDAGLHRAFFLLIFQSESLTPLFQDSSSGL